MTKDCGHWLLRWWLGALFISAPLAPPAAAFAYTNCGVEWQIGRVPTHLLAVNQHAADLLIALGATPFMVGVAWLDDDAVATTTGAYKGVPVVAKHYPSLEQTLNLGADFIVAGFPSAFTSAGGVGERGNLKQAGIGTYLLESGCSAPDERSFLDRVGADIKTVSSILGHPEAGRRLFNEIAADLATARALPPFTRRPSIFYYDDGRDAPVTQGRRGLLTELLDLAGAHNVFADLSGSSDYVPVSWEAVLQRDPDVIVLNDAIWSTATAKRQFLESDPVLSRLSAVREHRFVTLPFSFTSPGVFSGQAALRLARELRALPGFDAK